MAKCRISAADVDFQDGSADSIVKMAATDVGNDGVVTFTSALAGGVVNLAGVNNLTATGTINTSGALQVNGVDVATVTGVFWKQSVKVAELVSNVSTLSGDQTVDGISCTAGDRVLLGAQSTGAEDGIYEVAAGAWDFVSDLPSGADAAGVAVFAQEGTNADSGLVCTNDSGSAVVGTDGLTFSVFTGGAVANGSITTAKLAADAVNGDKIADDAVDSEHIAGGAIDAEHFAAGVVGETAIADNAVTIAKLGDLQRGVMIVGDASNETAELAAGTEAQVLVANANGDPTWVGFSTDMTIAANGVVTIEDNAVTTAKIINDAVTTDKITDANVTTAKIADDAITSAKLNEGWDTLGTAGQSHVVSTDASGNITLIGNNSDDHGDITSTYGESTFVNHNSTSDARVKQNIQTIEPEDGLEIIRKSRGVRFNWKKTGAACAGVVAQEAQVLVPELVHVRPGQDDQPSDMMSVTYSGYTGYLIAANQALLARVEALEGGGGAAAPRAAKRKNRDDRGSSKVSR